MLAQTFGGRWEVIASIGEGGQAHVFEVRDLRHEVEGRIVLKRLKYPHRLGRFAQEIAAMQQVGSPRVARVIDFAVAEPAYIVSPFVGPTLETFLGDDRTLDERLSLIQQVGFGLMAAHDQGVAHRDLKPDNVLVRNEREAVLADFGICQIVANEVVLTTTDELLGNASFAAPECQGAGGDPGTWSDIYSLGKLAYWAVTGKIMFRETIPEDTLPNPTGVERAHLRRLISQLVIASPVDRPAIRQAIRLVSATRRRIRLGVNAIGVRDQVCTACREGTMHRERHFEPYGLTRRGNPDVDMRVLRCDNCGHIQFYYIDGAPTAPLWEM